MTRTTSIISCGLLLIACGCSSGDPRPAPGVDCSVENAYEIASPLFGGFDRGVSDWFQFGDNTPNSQMVIQGVSFTPPRCGNTSAMELIASGHNFYGVGFGDWATNDLHVSGAGYEGISFWALSNTYNNAGGDKTFMLYVDDGRTYSKRTAAAGGIGGLLPAAAAGDQDLDGDGFIGPGDIFASTSCKLPPIQALGDPACYKGGVLAPGSPTRVPEPGECGNQFHTYITTTETWQFFTIPWSQLVQWPCPNRLDGGINPADIAQIEVKFLQGTNYDILVDNFAFYRRRADAGN